MVKLHGKWTLKLSATLCMYAAQYYKHSCCSISAPLHPDCRQQVFKLLLIYVQPHLRECPWALPIWINVWQHVEDTSLQSPDRSIIYPMPIIGMLFGRKPKLHNTDSGSDHTYTLTNQMRSFSLHESWRGFYVIFSLHPAYLQARIFQCIVKWICFNRKSCHCTDTNEAWHTL